MIRWNQDQDRLADDLVGRIAEEPLRTLIPARDDAVEVLAYDRVVGGLDDRGKPLFRYLRPLALGDVDQHVHSPDLSAGPITPRRWVGKAGKIGRAVRRERV